MVDLMNVDGGPAGSWSPAKLIGFLIGFFFAVLAAVALIVAFTLPSTISCYQSDTSYYVHLVPNATYMSASPQFVCAAQTPKTITFTGTGFISYGSQFPIVYFDNDSSVNFTSSASSAGTVIDIFRQNVSSYTIITAAVHFNASTPEMPTFTIAQPVPVISSAHFASQIPAYVNDGCTVTGNDLITLPPPSLTFVQPNVMCMRGVQTVLLDGTFMFFITNNGSSPMADGPSPAANDSSPTSPAPASNGTTTLAMRKRTLAPAPEATSVASTTFAANTTAVPASTAPVTLQTAASDMQTGGGSVALGSTTTTNMIGTSCEVLPLSSDVQVCTQVQAQVDVSMSAYQPGPVGTMGSLTLTNPEPIGCTSNSLTVWVVSPPKIVTMTPYVIFAQFAPAPVTVTGSGFLRVNGVVPTVSFQTVPMGRGSKTNADDPVPIEPSLLFVNGINVAVANCSSVAQGIDTCDTITFIVPLLTNSTLDVLDMIIQQPPPLDYMCGASLETGIFPSPTIDAGPYLSCASDGATFSLKGQFYSIAGQDVALLFDGAPAAVSFSSTSSIGLSQQNMGFTQVSVNSTNINVYEYVVFSAPTVVLQGNLTAYTPSVLVDVSGVGLTVPGATPLASQLTFVPNMQVAVPPFSGLCGSSGSATIQFSGSWFMNVNGVTPTASVVDDSGNMLSGNVSLLGCSGVSAPGFANLQQCSTMQVVVQNTATGMLTVTSPAPLTSCSYQLATELSAVSAPTLMSVQESTVCVGGSSASITLIGSFPLIGTALPNVVLNGVQFAGAVCTMTVNPTTCEKMTIMLDPAIASANAATIGLQNISVTVTASTACTSSVVKTLVGLPTGSITSVTPNRVCSSDSNKLTAAGLSLLNVMGSPVSVGYGLVGSNLSTNVATLTNFANCAGSPPLCTTASFVVPSLSSFLSGNQEVPIAVAVVTDNLCTATSAGPLFYALPQPLVTSLTIQLASTMAIQVPGRVCYDTAYVMTITGSGFTTTNNNLLLQFVDTTNVSNIITFTNTPSLVVSSAMIKFSMSAGAVPVGLYNVTVNNGDACEVVAGQLNVDPVVGVYLAIPRVVPASIPITIDIHTAGLVAGALTSLNASSTMLAIISSGPDVLTVTNSLSAGSYPVSVVSVAGCVGASRQPLIQVLPVASAITVVVDPPFFAGNGELKILAPSGTLFNPGTMVYLLNNGQYEQLEFPYVIDGGTAVRAIRSNNFPGLSALQVLVIDQVAGVFGVSAPNTFFSTLYTAVSDVVVPSTVASGSVTSTTVSMRVSDANPNITACSLICSSLTIACTTVTTADQSFSRVVATFLPSTLAVGDVCKVRLTSSSPVGAIGTIDSPNIAIVSNGSPAITASNVISQSSALKFARSNACATTVRAIPRAQVLSTETYLHVIGGLVGGVASPKVESALVSSTTKTLNFATSADLLTAVTDCSVAQLGQAVYVVSNNAVQRATILSANNAPALVFAVGFDSGSLPSGNYMYVVSSTDPNDGESVPSNTVELFVPVAPSASVTLNWTTVAAPYHVYRSVNGSAFALLSSQTATLLVDDGSKTVTATLPRSPGALGAFTTVVTGGGMGLLASSTCFDTLIDASDSSAQIVCSGGVSSNAQLLLAPSGSTVTLSSGNNLPGTMSQASFVRLTTSFATNSTVQPDVGEVWALYTQGAVYGSENVQQNPAFTSIANGYAGNVPVLACGAAAVSNAFFFGGQATSNMIASGSFGATAGAVNTANVNNFPIQQFPACARTNGKLFVVGGSASAVAVATVTTVVI